jgi:hypothetical protein
MIRAFLLTIALAVGAHAKPIVIGAFPYIIVAPGNYQVASYLSGPRTTGPGVNITINVTVPGKVVLDLNGVNLGPYAISARDVPLTDAIDVFAGTDITIQNGSIIGGGASYFFATGIYVNAGATGPYAQGAYAEGGGPPPLGAFLSNITINNIRFRTNLYGIVLAGVNGATVKNCYFFTGTNGIWDYQSKLGNTYVNNTFDTTVGNAFIVNSSLHRIVQQRSVFATPTPTP